MKDWKELKYTNTFKDLVDLFNINSANSSFIDDMIGTILSNGVIYNGNETVNGVLIRPLKKVEVSGVVSSDTILDNFTLYFRDTNNIVKLDMFPIDLLSYANGKPQFLYIREDLSYRVSDYMFGGADEILLARFVINTNSTWNQFYIMAQRAGTPMYNAADEFYDIDGMYIKSPGGLELSQTSGTVKRSGIDFTDRVSPDISQFYNLATQRVPIRYINTYNEVDYTKDTTWNVITDKYMVYNANKKYKIDAEQYIMNIQNLYYMIENYSNGVATELHDAIIAGGEQSELKQIVTAYIDYINIIYSEVDKLYDLLGNSTLSSVRRAAILENKNLINTYISSQLNTNTITESNVTAIKTVPCYIKNINLSVCSIPLENVLQEIQDGLDKITYNAGEIKNVIAGKFTIQRILWDVYEQSLIVQYGDTVYDSFNQAVEGTGLVAYPAPFGKTIYIPMAIMIVKSGATSINNDAECIIIDRRWEVVDQEMTDYADYVARAKSDKALTQVTNIINGTIAAKKADSLKCTVNGSTTYKDGDYFLDYNNLKNKIAVINSLTSQSTTNALSAYQGYILNNAIATKVPLSGGTMAGQLNTQNLIPTETNKYALGATSRYYKEAYITTGTITTLTSNKAYIAELYRKVGNVDSPYIISGGSSGTPVKDIRTMAKATADQYWNSIDNNTLVFCW